MVAPDTFNLCTLADFGYILKKSGMFLLTGLVITLYWENQIQRDQEHGFSHELTGNDISISL